MLVLFEEKKTLAEITTQRIRHLVFIILKVSANCFGAKFEFTIENSNFAPEILNWETINCLWVKCKIEIL